MRERFSIIVLFLLAFFIRFYGIERESLWLDEIGQVVVAQNSWRLTITQAATHAGSAPLDYLVTHFLLQFGQSEGILRLGPVLWGALSVVVTYSLGKSVFDRAVGSVAALMLLFTPIHVYYSREVRFYSLAVLLALATTWIFQWALKVPTAKRRWLLYAVVLCLGWYSHYYIGVVAGMQGIWLALKVWRNKAIPRRTFWYFVAATGSALLLFVPWIIYDNFILQSPGGQSFRFPSLNYLLSAPFSHSLLLPSRRQGSWLVAASFACAAVLLFAVKDRLKSEQSQYAMLFLSTFLAGMGAALTLDHLTGYFFAHRQLLIYTPFLLLVIAYGGMRVIRAMWCVVLPSTGKISDWLAAAAMVGFMLFALAPSLRTVYTIEQRENWRAVSRYLLQHSRESDLIIAPCTYCLEWYSPELAEQIISQHTTAHWVDHERVWFFDTAHLPEDIRSAIDLSTLNNLSPSTNFTLYIAEVPGAE